MAGAKIFFNDSVYDCQTSENVLDVLIKNGEMVNYSCRNGVCLTCMMRSVEGPVPEASQAGLRDTVALNGYFLPCVCYPDNDIHIAYPADSDLYGRAVVREKTRLAPKVCRLLLESATPLYYHAGQFINLRREDGLVRSYSLASHPQSDRFLEVHIRRMSNGVMSNWIMDELQTGDAVDIQGPNGDCFYFPGRSQDNLLMVGTGTGLAPLIGIVRDALHNAHSGEIYLYHGSRNRDGLYLHEKLKEFESSYNNFHYFPCLSGDEQHADIISGRAHDIALSEHQNLSGWRVFLCGVPDMVKSAQKTAFMAGAKLNDIYSDPFEVKELRSEPRG